MEDNKNKKLPNEFLEALKIVVAFIDDADNEKQNKDNYSA